MNSALIVSSGEKSTAFFSEALTMADIQTIVTVRTAGEARRLLIENDYNICIINAPLIDEQGERLALSIASKGISGVILCVKSEIYDEVTSKVENYGVITVSKPVSKSMFWNSLKITLAAHRKLQLMQTENRKLAAKIEDLKVVDRAKCLLISYLTMSESEAHRYIEKQAMDMRQTKREIAERILKTYEN